MYNVSDIFSDSLDAFRYAMQMYQVLTDDPLAYKRHPETPVKQEKFKKNGIIIDLDESQYEVLD